GSPCRTCATHSISRSFFCGLSGALGKNAARFLGRAVGPMTDRAISFLIASVAK
ncbi:MAG: hypothetical protein ACJAQT_004359, partial [Akkermansiaceae bacterium]